MSQPFSVDDCVENWLRSLAAARPFEAIPYRGLVRSYVSPYIGLTPIAELSDRIFLDWYTDLEALGATREDAETARDLVAAALSRAVRDGNACDGQDILPRIPEALSFRARWEQTLRVVRRRHIDRPRRASHPLRVKIRVFGRRMRHLPKGQLDLFRPE
ncbi:MAG TPA: hypothetical protein VEP50_11315 [bacterium]|nr:hypothetical protein [bacterium]